LDWRILRRSGSEHVHNCHRVELHSSNDVKHFRAKGGITRYQCPVREGGVNDSSRLLEGESGTTFEELEN
jgi:hypothetical protein